MDDKKVKKELDDLSEIHEEVEQENVVTEQITTMRQDTMHQDTNRRMLSHRTKTVAEPAEQDEIDAAFDRRQELLMFVERTINRGKTTIESKKRDAEYDDELQADTDDDIETKRVKTTITANIEQVEIKRNRRKRDRKK